MRAKRLATLKKQQSTTNIHIPAMKAFSSKPGRHDGANHSVLLLLAVVFMTLTGRAETLLTCTNNTSTGDRIERGFYVPAFPGNSLDSARLVFSSPTAGSYTVRLTVRSNAYDGIVLDSDETTFTLASSTDLAGRWGSRAIQRGELDEWAKIYQPPTDEELATYDSAETVPT